MEKYTIELTREQYIVIKTTLNQEAAKAFTEGDQLAFEMLQSAYRAVIEAGKTKQEETDK